MTKVDVFLKMLEEETEQDITTSLDPNFFDDNHHLKPEVRSRLMELAQDVLSSLKKQGFELTPAFVILGGSLLGSNWDEFSDVDFHFGVDFSKYQDPVLTRNYLQSFAKAFNQSKDLKLLGRELEIYFQDAEEKFETPGIYDVQNDHWVKFPDGVQVEITPHMEKAAEQYLQTINQYVDYWNQTVDKKDHAAVGDFLDTINGYWDSIMAMRKEAMLHGGMYAEGNQIFKMLRRNGAFDKFNTLTKGVEQAYYDIQREARMRAQGV